MTAGTIQGESISSSGNITANDGIISASHITVGRNGGDFDIGGALAAFQLPIDNLRLPNVAHLATSSHGGSFIGDVVVNGGVVAFPPETSDQPAGQFIGDVFVTGTLTTGGGGFRIAHPLDATNKYLSHSFVESPDMKNIYDGVAVLDANGEAVVESPAWFEALNIDFRYQLTCLGEYAPVYIAEKIHDQRYKIAGGKSAMEVSWQVTGIRQDAYAIAHRIPVEQNKLAEEQGYYLHPGLHGEPEGKQVHRVRYPEISREMPLRKQ